MSLLLSPLWVWNHFWSIPWAFTPPRLGKLEDLRPMDLSELLPKKLKKALGESPWMASLLPPSGAQLYLKR